MTVISLHKEDIFRPAIHYTAKNTWMNDPNGLVYHEGIYHLYYQNNPFGNVWGNMSWGHATSVDLVHWEEQPVAILCDADTPESVAQFIDVPLVYIKQSFRGHHVTLFDWTTCESPARTTCTAQRAVFELRCAHAVVIDGF